MKNLLAFIILLTSFTLTNGQTVGTIDLDFNQVEDGYTIISPLGSFNTYLINNCGEIVKQWTSSYAPGNEVFLDEEGRLWRAGRANVEGAIGAGGRGGVIEVYDWDGGLIWSYTRCDTSECMHHDFKRLENGNLLILVWDKYESDEAINQGINPESVSPAGVWSEYLEEISIDLNVPDQATAVWQWHAWDHLVQDFDSEKPNFGNVNSPNKINLNFEQNIHPDWLHINAIDYNPELDQIILSVPHFDEFWIVDHNTTSAEASTEAGDLLYRWGNPASYGAGDEDDKQLFFMHNPHWVSSGLNFEEKIILFNNLNSENGVHVSAVEVITPSLQTNGGYAIEDSSFLPSEPDYTYLLPEELAASKVSGVQVLKNGNLLICSGVNATLIEINENEEIVWKYVSPIDGSNQPVAQGSGPTQLKWLFRAYKYTPDFEGFVGKDLTPGDYIETNSGESYCEIISVSETDLHNRISVFPNPAKDRLSISNSSGFETLEIISALGQVVRTVNEETDEISISKLESGTYILKMYYPNGETAQVRFVKE